MKEIQLEDVRELCEKRLKDCRLVNEDEEYSSSLNFYGTNGFYYEECWNLDVTIAALILPRLIHYRDSCVSTPTMFIQYDEEYHVINGEEAHIKWIEVLNKMIEAFYLVVADTTLGCTMEELKSISNRINEGLNLFAKYYLSLWD